MMIKIIVLFNLCFLSHLFSQTAYSSAYEKLNALTEVNHSFKYAVFIVENAYNSNISYEQFQNEITLLADIAKVRQRHDSLIYTSKDYQKISTYGSIFKTLTDTSRLFLAGEKYIHYPFRYDFNDIFGSKDWSNMFVTKLLATRKGNCHSMPYLYKILCDELNVPCHLALAPNHLYIKHRAEKGGWYNTELTSASFPIDAWLMASGYISLEAVQNGIYLDTLSAKENIALCVIDLAQGYNYKYSINDGKFVIECCDLALKYFPDYVNAMILKAETRLKQLENLQELYHYPSLKEAAETKEGKPLWKEMNNLYGKIHKLGYRQMPEKMYVEWLTLLKTEREKYSNKQFEQINKR